MKTFEVLSEAIAAEGVTAIFGVMGDGNMRWLAKLAETHPEVRVYYARHENSAAGMADGYARATGKLGVCTVTQGPGVLLAGTSLMNASRHGSSVLLIAGDVPRGDQRAIQYLDHRRFAETLGMRAFQLIKADTIAEDVSYAFATARASNAPVILSFPTDLQEEDYDWELEYAPSTRLTPARQRVTADPALLARACEMLRAAQRPMIVAGRGAVKTDARDLLEELAARLGAPLSTTLAAKGYFHGSPLDVGIAGLFSSPETQALFARADCVLAVGASLNHYTTEAGALFPSASVIQVDLKPFRPPEGLRSPDCYLQADARGTVEALLAALGPVAESSRERWWTDGSSESTAPTSEAPAVDLGGLLNQHDVMRTVDRTLRGDNTFVIGMGHFWWFPIHYLQGRSPEAYVFTHDFGAIGQGLPTAIGAAVGRPDRRIVVIEGDASILMCIQELNTAARYRIPLTVVVMNDEGVGAEWHHLRAEGLDPTPSILPSPDLATVARGFGARGFEVRTLEELEAALDASTSTEGPCLIDVRVSREILADPYRHLWFGQ